MAKYAFQIGAVIYLDLELDANSDKEARDKAIEEFKKKFNLANEDPNVSEIRIDYMSVYTNDNIFDNIEINPYTLKRNDI